MVAGEERKRWQGILCAVLSSALSSVAWLYQGEAVRHLGPFVTGWALYAGSGSVLFLYLLLKRRLPRIVELRPHTRDLILITLIRGVLAPALYCFALTLTTGIKLMFFTKLEPYFVLFFSWATEQQPVSKRQVLLLALHIAGAIVLSTNAEFDLDSTQYGDLLVILTVGLVALTYAPATRVTRAIGPLRTNCVVNVGGGVLALPLALLTASAPLSQLPTAGWENVIVALLMFQLFGLTFWYVALHSIRGWIVSALRATGPVIAAPFAYYFYGQELTQIQIVGAVVVLATSALIAREQRN